MLLAHHRLNWCFLGEVKISVEVCIQQANCFRIMTSTDCQSGSQPVIALGCPAASNVSSSDRESGSMDILASEWSELEPDLSPEGQGPSG